MIEIIMGDTSADGHGQTDSIYIESNLTVQQIQAAYNKGTKLVGFNLVDSVAADYEDNKITVEDWNKLIALGFDGTSMEDDDDEDHLALWTDSFSEIYFFICKLGDPTFTYNVTKYDRIDIGGYGLFS